MPVEKSAVAEAFSRLNAFFTSGEAVVDGEEAAKLVESVDAMRQWLGGLSRALAGAHLPAKIAHVEHGGMMMDKDTPGPVFLEFAAEHQAG